MVVSSKARKKLLEVDDFKTYPKWFRKVLARRLLLMLIPDKLSRNLPRWLSAPIFGDNSVYPADLPWPAWMVIPPDFIWPDFWTPWIMMDFAPGLTPDTAFPGDWQPGDPLPTGVTLQPGYVIPTDWTPYTPLPPGVIVPPGVEFPIDWTSGDPLPAGVIIPPGVEFPPDWTPPSPPPAGVIIPPGVVFPPYWTSGDPPPAGVIIPPGITFPRGGMIGGALPAGVIIPPGVVFPADWTSGDPPPAGVIIPPGVTFPRDWMFGVAFPAGVIVPLGTEFPPDWTPPSPLPPGVIVPPGVFFPPNWMPTAMPPWGFFWRPRIEVQDQDTIGPIDYTWLDPHGPYKRTHTDGPLPSTTVHIVETDALYLYKSVIGSWDLNHDAVSAGSKGRYSGFQYVYYCGATGAPRYTVTRTIHKFDLSSIPAGVTIEAGIMYLKGTQSVGALGCAQAAPGALWDYLGDFSSMSGSATLPVAIEGTTFTFYLVDDILTDLNANIGGFTYIITREYSHDYLDAAPGASTFFQAFYDTPKTPPAFTDPELVLRYRS